MARPRGQPHQRPESAQAGASPIRTACERRAQRDPDNHQREHQDGKAPTAASIAVVDGLPTASGASTAPTHERRGHVPREYLTLSLLVLHDAAAGCANLPLVRMHVSGITSFIRLAARR